MKREGASVSLTTKEKLLVQQLLFPDLQLKSSSPLVGTRKDRGHLVSAIQAEGGLIQAETQPSASGPEPASSELHLLLPGTTYHVSISRSALELIRGCWSAFRLMKLQGGFEDYLNLASVVTNIKDCLQELNGKEGEICVYKAMINASTGLLRDLAKRFPTADEIVHCHLQVAPGSSALTSCIYRSNGKCCLTTEDACRILENMRSRGVVRRIADTDQYWACF